MPPVSKGRPNGEPITGRTLKLLRLRPLPGPPGAAQAARRPLVPTHAANTTSHLRRHVARSAQS